MFASRITKTLSLVASAIVFGMVANRFSVVYASDSARSVAQEGSPKKLLNPPQEKDRWWMRQGKGCEFCEAVYREISKYTPEELGNCVDAIVLATPGVQEAGGWKELDPREHEELYKRIWRFDAVGRDAYFDPSAPSRDKAGLADRGEEMWKGFLQAGGRMRTLQTPLFARAVGHPDVAYASPQTLLEYRFKLNKSFCVNASRSADEVVTHFVSADLSGPDPAVLGWESNLTENVTRLIEYHGQTLLMAGNKDLTFYKKVKGGDLDDFVKFSPTRPSRMLSQDNCNNRGAR
jgi:hypothetical protein